jgi:hypothetical protein
VPSPLPNGACELRKLSIPPGEPVHRKGDPIRRTATAEKIAEHPIGRVVKELTTDTVYRQLHAQYLQHIPISASFYPCDDALCVAMIASKVNPAPEWILWVQFWSTQRKQEKEGIARLTNLRARRPNDDVKTSMVFFEFAGKRYSQYKEVEPIVSVPPRRANAVVKVLCFFACGEASDGLAVRR